MEKVTYCIGVNIIGINNYVEHFIPEKILIENNDKNKKIKKDNTIIETKINKNTKNK